MYAFFISKLSMLHLRLKIKSSKVLKFSLEYLFVRLFLINDAVDMYPSENASLYRKIFFFKSEDISYLF